jgi:hypothetical protein
MHRSLLARYFNQFWVIADNTENFARAQKQHPPPPALMNAPAMNVAEVIAVQ